LPIPASALYLPTSQVWQLALPDVFLNLPFAHAKHACPLRSENPMLHKQAVEVVLLAAEFEWAGQYSQLAFPISDLYWPSAHAVQLPSLVPENPALHKQNALLAVGNEFTGQS